MRNNRSLVDQSLKSPLSELFSLLLIFFGMYFLASVMLIAISTYTPFSTEALLMSESLTRAESLGLMAIQSVFSILIFVVSAIIFFMLKKNANVQFKSNGSLLLKLILVFLLLFAATPFIALLVEWIDSINFPESFSSLEKNAREFEEKYEKLANSMILTDSVPMLLVSVVVIALIPAIGEELFFRGAIQPVLSKIFKNHHLGIILTGIFFSIIHFSLFGFLPRVLLGCLFGYIYYYSRNLFFPILAHFINNGSIVLLSYLHTNNMIELNVQEKTAPSWPIILVSIILFAFIWQLFYRICKKTEGVSNYYIGNNN